MKDQQTYTIIGAAMTVHRELGYGFLEAVYHDALAIELTDCNIPFQHEVPIPIHYKSQQIDASYRADFLCYDRVIVELKALGSISGIEEAQLLNYIKATTLPVGLLINFGAPSLEYKRMVFSASKPEHSH